MSASRPSQLLASWSAWTPKLWTTTVGILTAEDVEDARPHQLQDQQVPPYVTILRIHGPFLFGATEKLLEETADLNKYAGIVILRLRHMTAIDATGLHGLEVLSDRLKKSGRTLLLCGARHQPAKMLKRADFIEHIGEHNILPKPRSNGRAKSRRALLAWAKNSPTT